MNRILVEPDETARRIREYGRQNPDLRKDEYDGRDGPVDGLCYPLAEAYWHAKGGTELELLIYCLSWADVDDDLGGTGISAGANRDRGWILGSRTPLTAA